MRVFSLGIECVCARLLLPFVLSFALGWTGVLSAQDELPQKISFMTFNVENLFDTRHDDGKNDFTYLPLSLKRSPKFLDSKDGEKFLESCVSARFKNWRLSCLTYDWSEEVLNQKLAAVARVIKSSNGGKGADVIFLQEVENIRVLNMLLENELAGLGYSPVLIEGQDDRGIDTAILSKWKVKAKKLHAIQFPGVDEDRAADTRGILQASLEGPGGIPIEAFSVHFPAPFHPTKMRERALDTLEEITKDLHDTAITVVGGDFNITSREDKKESLTQKRSKKRWNVSHLVGCKECPGSSYYPPKKDWSFLDHIWVSKTTEKLGWKLNTESIQLVNHADDQSIKKPFLHPKRMEIENGKLSGVSDHWPVYLELNR